MKLIECHIENFGKLSDFKLTFSPGMNSVKKDNGYGKTTLSVFIKSMLYGLDDTKRQKLESNDRKHYMPWQGGRAGGSLTFEHRGQKYRIERTFMPKAGDDTFKLYDARSGKECFDFTENLGEELFGVDADGFERTVFLSEQNLSGKNENKTISAKLSDLVGADGDIGVMDDALELLEKQRRFYYKRGGTGEIGDIKRKIGNLDIQINDLYRAKDSRASNEKRLDETNRMLEKLNGEKKKLENEEKQALMRTYERHYLEIKKQLDDELSRKEALLEFFKHGIPEREELERIKKEDAELKSLGMLEGSGRTNSEYASLSAFFACGAEDSEFDNLKSLCAKIENGKREVDVIKRNLAELPTDFKKQTDAEDKYRKITDAISDISEKGRAKSKWSPIAFTVLGFLLLGLGVVLGSALNPIIYLLSVPGVLLCLIGITGFIRAENSRKKKYSKISFTEDRTLSDSELLSRLYDERARLEKLIEAKKQYEGYEEKINSINSEILEANREACEFISRFPVKSMGSVAEAGEEILTKRSYYIALKQNDMYTKQKESEREQRKRELSENVGRFILRYPTKTSYPLSEIEQGIMEYQRVSESIENIKRNLDDFALTHGIIPENISGGERSENTSAASKDELLQKITQYERERTLIERDCKAAEAELDRLDFLVSEKEELIEKEKAAEEKLNIILKTQDYLSRAKDLLTSKYLSKTKKAFDGYVELICREEGEDFKMDTSFAVSKNERGSLKPAEAYSQGTRDIYALAARLALVDSIYENEAPFIVLDDPFAHLDDKKLKASMNVLSEIAKKKQIIYLTCASSRDF